MTQLGIRVVTPTAGSTVTAPDWCEHLSMTPAGTLATLTVNPPANPKHGQPFVLGSTQIITALTMTALNGQTIAGALTALAVSVSGRWTYNAPNATWYPA